jgi:hypothetical protein
MFGCFIIDVFLRKQREAKNEAEQSNEKENGKSTDRLFDSIDKQRLPNTTTDTTSLNIESIGSINPYG